MVNHFHFKMSSFNKRIKIQLHLYEVGFESKTETILTKIVDHISYRFIMCLCVPMIQVLLHTIIDDLRDDENKVYKMENVNEKKWWKKASVWITIARVGLPLTYMLGALAIVVPGIINMVVEGSRDEF